MSRRNALSWVKAYCSQACWTSQALPGRFHSQPLPPQMFCEVRTVQPRTRSPKRFRSARVAARQPGTWETIQSTSGSWHSARLAGPASQ